MTLSAGVRLGPYEIVAPVGAGGMGEVYRARDTRLGRDVAIKVLPSDLATDPERLRRFEQEARTVAALSHPNIVALFDIGTHDGAPFLVSELLEGRTLREEIASGPRPIRESVDAAVQVARGLSAAHEKGIVHRDLKPANVFVTKGGHVKILDFGIAKLTRPESVSGTTTVTRAPATETGAVLGTVGYMAPEQVRGLPCDHRADIFAFGCVLYEMLSGLRAFQGATPADTMSAILKDDPPPLGDVRREVPAGLQQIVDRCLAKRPESRLSSAHDLALALEAVPTTPADPRQAEPAGGREAPKSRSAWRTRRVPVVAAVVIVLVVGGALTVQLVQRRARVRWARDVALPEIARLIDRDDTVAAYTLAEQAEQVLPGNAALQALFARASQYLSIKTTPPGAAVYYAPYARPKPSERHLGVSPINGVRVPLKPYWLRGEEDGFETWQQLVWLSPFEAPGGVRQVEFALEKKGSVPVGMVRIPPSSYAIEFYGLPKTAKKVPEFLVDDHEVTNSEFERFVSSGGYEKPEYWVEPFVREGRVLRFREAVAAFVDKTGRPGPATWEAGRFPDGQENYPVSGVSWYEAAAFAKFAGKSLPTVYHWSAATWTGSSVLIVPFSNFDRKGPRPIRSGPVGLGGTWDMAGNVKEWCWNAAGDRRLALGGAWNDASYMFAEADARPPFDRENTLGFRCVVLVPAGSSVAPDFTGPVVISGQGRLTIAPVSEETYRAYERLYAYESVPLGATAERAESESPLWTKERITFDAAYGHERVAAFLFLPKNTAPPYQTMVYFPGAAFQEDNIELEIPVIDFVIKSGRALMFPVPKGTYERRIKGLLMANASKTKAYTDLVVQWIRDFTRSVDYLGTRREIDQAKLAYYGFSWGASMGPIAVALEPRLRLGVFLDGGLWPEEAFPEAMGATFAPRIKVPILMVNGMQDVFFPLETSQKPLFNLLGTAASDKKASRFDSHHGVIALHRNEVQKEILDWLDRYFGVPRRSG